jgi:hypothetical protein
MTLNYLLKKIFLICMIVLMSFFLSVTAFSFIEVGGVSLNQRIKGHFSSFNPGVNPGQTLLRFRDIEKVKKVDILFSGSSHAMRGFDPRIFSKENATSYNVGSASQTPLNSFFILKKYLPILKPKIVIVELFPNVLANDGYESFIDLITNLELSEELLQMSFSLKSISAIISIFEVFIKRFDSPLQDVKQKFIEGESYIKGGYTEIHKIRNADDQTPSDVKLNPSDQQMLYIEKIINLSKKYNSEILFVIHPLPIDYLSSISNYDQVSALVKHFVEKKGSVLMDFNYTLPLGSYDNFMDAHHLNSAGVKLFNEALIDVLKKHPRYQSILTQ